MSKKPADIAPDLVIEGDAGPGAAAGEGAQVSAENIAGGHLLQLVQQLPDGMGALGQILVEFIRGFEEVRKTAERAALAWESDKALIHSFDLHLRQVEDRMDGFDYALRGNGDEGVNDQIRRLRDEMARVNHTLDTRLAGFAEELGALATKQDARLKAVERRQDRQSWWLIGISITVAVIVAVPVVIVVLRGLGFL